MSLRGALVLLTVLAAPVTAQRDSLRMRVSLEDAARVGRPAPSLALPYVTPAGAGPVDQPFDLSRELGRVVVLQFVNVTDSTAQQQSWRWLRDASDSLAAGDVVVASVVRGTAAQLLHAAAAGQWPFKLLADPAQDAARRFGLRDGAMRLLVVGRDGRVRWLDQGGPAAGGTTYAQLAAAVRAAKETS